MLSISSDTLAKRTTHAAYVLILVWARDRRSARRHGKSSHMAHIGRGVAVDAGAPMTAAYGADGHSHQRASSAEGSESQGGRSSAIVRERLFQGITVPGSAREGVNPFLSVVIESMTRAVASSIHVPSGLGRRPPDRRSRPWGRANGPRPER